MAGEEIARLLPRLNAAGAILRRENSGEKFALLVGGDRRRRPLARLQGDAVRALLKDGALEEIEPGVRYRLSAAGRARARRAGALPEEGYRAQHEAVGPRSVMDGDGEFREVRGLACAGVLARLGRLEGAGGVPFLEADELEAARRLRADWEAGQLGLVRASDVSAPPRSGNVRGAGGGVEYAQASAVDARRRLERALASLAPMLAAAVRGICLLEQGLAALERAQGWPGRSGKVALKMGLAQLAAFYRGG